MKIIKKGTKTPPDKKIYVIRCPQCEYSVPIPFIKKKYKGSDREC